MVPLVLLVLVLALAGHWLASINFGPIALLAVVLLGLGFMFGGRRACGSMMPPVVSLIAFLVIAAMAVKLLVSRG